jgi:hypothetical protein
MAEYPKVDLEKQIQDRLNFIKDISTQAPAGRKILEECLDIAELLITKNRSYGSSYNKTLFLSQQS